MNLPAPAADRRATAVISAPFVAGWAAFCALMVLVGLQEEVLDGRGAVGWRLFDELVSMTAATVVAVLRWRAGPHDDPLLATPARWFWRVTRWAPLVALLFVLAVYGIRHASRAALGEIYLHPPWPAVLGYETLKFGIFYLLFAGVQFGLRSHAALAGERERAERAQRLLGEARLAQLTQQMQPHFLFNALNTRSRAAPASCSRSGSPASASATCSSACTRCMATQLRCSCCPLALATEYGPC